MLRLYLCTVNNNSCIEPTAQNMQSAYYQSSEVISLAERKRNMLLINELFMLVIQ
jgi:hypothetical protein